jgi:cytochrome c5
MKAYGIIAAFAAALLVSAAALAAHDTPEERGKALFNDPKLGGGTAGNSCNTCHPGGKGLEGVGGKKEWKNPGGTFTSLEAAINVCIEMALKGKALDAKSGQMKDLVSYLKSLKPGAGKTPGKKPVVGC